MDEFRYKFFCLVFENRKLVWKGGVEVRAYDAVGAEKAAKKKLQERFPNAYVHVPLKNNPRLV